MIRPIITASLAALTLGLPDSNAMAQNTAWTMQVSKADCNTTPQFNASTARPEVSPCQSYNADVYENWDLAGSDPGQVDLMACDYAVDDTFYYMRWDVRTNWSNEGHRYYQELELNSTLSGGDVWPDVYLEYAPKTTHIGTAWQALGQSQILLFRDSNNNYGCTTSRLTPSADSCADGYETDAIIPSNAAYGRVFNGNLEIAVRRTTLDGIDDSPSQISPVAVRCWASQSSTIDKTKVAWHDENPISNLTGNRFDNNVGVDTSTWSIVSPVVKLAVAKSSVPYSDPVNNLSNPKFLPGGVALYTITVTNTSTASPTANSVEVRDLIPEPMVLYVGDVGAPGSGPVQFIDGSPVSGLTYTFTSLASTTDSVSFSNNGGTTFTYVPAPDAGGFDSQVTHIRVIPSGTFNGSNRNFQLRVRMKTD